MLETDPSVEDGVVGVGDVAGGPDPRRTRGQVLVDDDAVVKGQTGRLGQLGPRTHAYSDHEEVSRHDTAVGQDNLFGRGRASEFLDADTHVKFDSLVSVQVPKHGAHLRAEDAFEGNLTRFDQGDLFAELASGGGDL